MPLTIEQFGKAIVDAGIMPAEELKALFDALPPDVRPKDSDQCAKLLIKKSVLTEFQARQLLAGRGAALLLNQYVLQEKIGAGGMGQVFKARHRKMKRLAAIKLLPPAMVKDKDAIRRFQREVEAAARLTHPNIVATLDADECKGMHYMAMEYVDGKDLSATVKEFGPLPVDAAINYILQAARGLAYAHDEGVVHRDIKPANLLLDKKGVVKILDMGLARIEDSSAADQQLTNTGAVMGTVDYMAPEQATDTRNADARSDVYSLGCTLYRIVTGESVFEGDTVVKKIMAHMNAPIPSLLAKRPEAPAELDRIFQKMLAKRPDDRYRTAGEVVAALEALRSSSNSGTEGGSVFETSDPNLSQFLSGIGRASGSNLGGMGSNSAIGPQSGPGSGVGRPSGDPGGSSPSQRGQVAASANSAACAAGSGIGIGKTVDFDDNATAAFGYQPLKSLDLSNTQNFKTAPEVDTDPKSSVHIQRAPRVATAAGNQQPPWKNPKILAGGGAAFLFVLLGVIFVIRDKDGNEIARVEAPAGSTVEVKPTPPKKLTDEEKMRLANENSPFKVGGGTPAPKTTPEPRPSSEPRNSTSVPLPGDYALSFNGQDSYVEIPGWHYRGDTPITLEAWATLATKPHPGHPDTLMCDWQQAGMGIGVDGSANNKDGSPNKNQGQWGAQFAFGGKYANAHEKAPPPRGRRVHFAATYDGRTTLRFFIDGDLQSTAETSGAYNIGYMPFLLGANPNPGKPGEFNATDVLNGLIDEVRISKTVRYPGKFTPLARFEPDADTLMLYHFDEGAGDVLVDSSANKRHGKIVNAKWVRPDGTPINNEPRTFVSGTASPPLTNVRGSESNGTAGPRWPFDPPDGREYVWSEPENLGPNINVNGTDGGPAISGDGLTLVFLSVRPGLGGYDLWIAERKSRNEPFGAPENMGPAVNSPENDSNPWLSADALTMIFASERQKANGRAFDLYQATRATRTDKFGAVVAIDEVNSGAAEISGALTGDGRTIYFASNRAGGSGLDDIYRASRADRTAKFDKPTPLGPPINTPDRELYPWVSGDAAVLLFARGDQNSSSQPSGIYVAVRSSPTGPFDSPTLVGPPVSLPKSSSAQASLTSDGQTMFFSSQRPGSIGGFDIWVTHRVLKNPSAGPSWPFDPPDGREYVWSEPENLGPSINGPNEDGLIGLTNDERRIFFGGKGTDNVWRKFEAVRGSVNEPFGKPTVMTGLSTDAYLSGDGLSCLQIVRKDAGEHNFAMLRRPSLDAAWGKPEELGPDINTTNDERRAVFSTDGLAIVFSRTRQIPTGGWRNELWLSRRKSLEAPFEAPEKFGPPINQFEVANSNTTMSGVLLADNRTLVYRFNGKLHVADIGAPGGAATALPITLPCGDQRSDSLDLWFTPDGRSLYFTANRDGGLGGNDIWMSRRVPRDPTTAPRWPFDPLDGREYVWSQPENLGSGVNSAAAERMAGVRADGQAVHYVRDRSCFYASRPTGDAAFSNGAKTPMLDDCNNYSVSATWQAFAIERQEAGGPKEIWLTARQTSSSSLPAAVRAPAPVNTDSSTMHPTLSPDGLTLLCTSMRKGCPTGDIWMFTRTAIDQPFTTAEQLSEPIRTPDFDIPFYVSNDRCFVIAAHQKTMNIEVAGKQTQKDVRKARYYTRNRPTEPFAPGRPLDLALGEAEDSIGNGGYRLSDDGRTIFFDSSSLPGGKGNADIWQARRVPKPVINRTIPAEALTFNGHRYLQVPGTLTWPEAKIAAERLGGHLATITSKEENDWITANFITKLEKGLGLWLGGTNEGSPQQWRWVTGEPFDYQVWAHNEPKNDPAEPVLLYVNSESGPLGWGDINHAGRGNHNRLAGYLVEWDVLGSGVSAGSSPAGVVYLDDLPPVEISGGNSNVEGHGWGYLKKWKISWQDKSVEHSLFTHPAWSPTAKPVYAVYQLPAAFDTFAAEIGLAKEGPKSPLTFRVLGDDKLLFEKKGVVKDQVGELISVNVRGVSKLRLEVVPEGTDASNCHAVWINPQLTSVSATSHGSVPAPADAQVFGAARYKVFKDKLSWTAARDRCAALGGHLAIVQSDAENAFIVGLMKAAGVKNAWLGATDEVVEGKWVWVDGSPLTYSNWDKQNRQPNNSGNGRPEHYLAIDDVANGTWWDYPNDNYREPGFVCQWDAVSPASSTVYLDDLQEVESKVDYGGLRKHGIGYSRPADKNAMPPLLWQGKPVQHSLTTHPPQQGSSFAVYRLAGRYETFEATVGISKSNARPESGVKFRVLGDGKELWKLPSIYNPDTGAEAVVTVRGVDELRLEVESVSEGKNGNCHAVWIEPRLTPVAQSQPGVVYLDDLPEDTWSGHLRLGKHNLDYNGWKYTWRGQEPMHALSTHPRSNDGAKVSYRLAARYDTLSAVVGLAEGIKSQSRTPLVFRVLGDGRELWKSPPIQTLSMTESFSVSVAGVQELQLEVNCPGDNFNAHAVWLNPRLTPVAATPPAVVYLDDLPEVEAKVGYASLGKRGKFQDPQNPNTRIVLRGATVEHALWMHPAPNSTSFVRYQIEGRYKTFAAEAGLNESAGGDPGTPITFRVLGDGRELWKSAAIQKLGAVEAVAIDVRGVKELRLETSCGARNSKCHGTWFNPRLTPVTPSGATIATKQPSHIERLTSPDYEWTEPESLGPVVNDAELQVTPALTSDELSLFVVRFGPTNDPKNGVWEFRRATADAPWEVVAKVAGGDEGYPSVTADGLTLVTNKEQAKTPPGKQVRDLAIRTRANRTAQWSNRTELPAPLTTEFSDYRPVISPDGLTLVFSSDRPGGSGGLDLWISRRADAKAAWQAPENLGPQVNSAKDDAASQFFADGSQILYSRGDTFAVAVPAADGNYASVALPPFPVASNNHKVWISTDGRTLYFANNRIEGGLGKEDIWIIRREAKRPPGPTQIERLLSDDYEWSAPESLWPRVDGAGRLSQPTLSDDQLSLIVFRYGKSGDKANGLVEYRRPTVDGPWGEAVQLTGAGEGYPSLRGNGLMLFTVGDSPKNADGKSHRELFLRTRPTPDSPWGAPATLPLLNTEHNEYRPVVSPDGLTLVFSSNRPGGSGGMDLWISRRADLKSAWQPPVSLGDKVNTTKEETASQILADNKSILAHRGDGALLVAAPDAKGNYALKTVPLPGNVKISKCWLALDGATLYFDNKNDSPDGYNEVRLMRRVPKPGVALPSEPRTSVSGTTASTIDLLALVDPVKHALNGPWKKEKGVLISPQLAWMSIELPVTPGPAYRLELEAERKLGSDNLDLVLPIAGRDVRLVFEGYKSRLSGLSNVNGKAPRDPAYDAPYRMPIFHAGRPTKIVVEVSPTSVRAQCDDQTIVDWQGDARSLGMPPSDAKEYNAVPGHLMLGAWGSEFHVSKLTYTPLTGTATKTTLDRRVAQRLLDLKFPITVTVNGKKISLKPGAPLPAEPFVFTGIDNYAEVSLPREELLALLSEFRQLQGLTFSYMPRKDCDLWAETFAALPSITSVNVASCAEFTDTGAAHLARLPKLTYIQLGSPNVTRVGIAAYEKCKLLTTIELDAQGFNDGKYTLADVQRLQDALPTTRVVFGGVKPIPGLKPAAAAPGNSSGAKTWQSLEFQRWIADTQKQPADKQLEAVSKKLIELNPGFDGKLLGMNYVGHPEGSPKIDKGVVTEVGLYVSQVADLSPIRAFAGLRRISCERSGAGPCQLTSLEPLRGMALNKVVCLKTEVFDLSPLEGMPLSILDCSNTKISELSPLRGSPLGGLYCSNTRIRDLSPLKDAPLGVLMINATDVDDLRPLEGCKKLKQLTIKQTKVTAAQVAALQKALPNCNIEWDEPQK